MAKSANAVVFKTTSGHGLRVQIPPLPLYIDIPITQSWLAWEGGPEVRVGIEGASMVKMLFSVVRGATDCTVALTVCTGSLQNGAPS